jgi:hypothetical protein
MIKKGIKKFLIEMKCLVRYQGVKNNGVVSTWVSLESELQTKIE